MFSFIKMPDFAGAVQLRVACPSDMDAIQRLCLECFPVRYPDVWYTELVSTTRYITVLAFICHTNQNQELEETIVGLIVAEYRNINSCKIAVRLSMCLSISFAFCSRFILFLLGPDNNSP